MLGSTVLEVTLGLCLYFIALSLVCSGVTQYFSGWRKGRGRILVGILGELVNHAGGGEVLTSLLGDARIAGGPNRAGAAPAAPALRAATGQAVPLKSLPLPAGGRIGGAAFADTLLDMMTKRGRVLQGEAPADGARAAPDADTALVAGKLIQRLNSALDAIQAGVPFAVTGMDLGHWEALIRDIRARVASLSNQPLGAMEREADAIITQLRTAAVAGGGSTAGAGLVDVIAREGKGVIELARGLASARTLSLVADDLPESAFKNFLVRLANRGSLQPGEIKDAVEEWYGSVNDRVSIEFRGKTQRTLFITALGVVLMLNADTLQFINRLARDEVLRKNVSEVSLAITQQEAKGDAGVAKTAAPGPAAGGPVKSTTASGTVDAKRNAEMSRLDIPLKWTQEDFDSLKGLGQYQDTGRLSKGLYKALGLLITALALTMGAEFWYNLLKNLVATRQQTSKEESAPGSG